MQAVERTGEIRPGHPGIYHLPLTNYHSSVLPSLGASMSIAVAANSAGGPLALNETLKVFSGTANPTFTQHVCNQIGIPVGKARVESFPDTELIVKLGRRRARAGLFCRSVDVQPGQ